MDCWLGPLTCHEAGFVHTVYHTSRGSNAASTMPVAVGGARDTDARSEASGTGSARSTGSRHKYRVVSRGSDVDESLFGSSNSHKGRSRGYKGGGSERRVLVGEVGRSISSETGEVETVEVLCAASSGVK